MRGSAKGRFQAFFKESGYVNLKNYLYNYLLRKRAIQNRFKGAIPGKVLEVGCGLSPIMTNIDKVVFSELSHTALGVLRAAHGRGWYVVCDCTQMPFKADAFSHVVCSEVLEHIADDTQALTEISRVLGQKGRVVITFPHRKLYFAADDRFVEHFRRYELQEMQSRLENVGFKAGTVKKVLGPLDKVAMCLAVLCYKIVQKKMMGNTGKEDKVLGADLKSAPAALLFKWANLAFALLARLDAWIIPRFLATILLIDSEKNR